MAAVDATIPQPSRDVDKPFLMPIEDVFSIQGRGTVVTGRVERGAINVGDEVEIVGIRDTQTTTCTGVEMFRKILDRGEAGDNVGVLVAARSVTRLSVCQCVVKPNGDASLEVHRRGLHSDQGRGWPAQAFQGELPSSVLLPYHGRDRHHRADQLGER